MKRRIDHDNAVDAASAAFCACAAADAAAATAVAVAIAADEALGDLDQVACNGAIMSMLVNTDMSVRHAAVVALFKLDTSGSWLVPKSHVLECIGVAMLAPHADYIVSMLSNTESCMRYRALHLVKFAAAGIYTPTVLARLCSAVAIIVRTDKHISLRNNAEIVLARLNALYHWARARAFVKNEYLLIRPYARFWYEYACKQLCAQGGKWAERDRTAYEDEFCELL